MGEVERKAQCWDAVAEIARGIDAEHRGAGGPGMADDDLVGVIAGALRAFPGLVKQRDLLQKQLDAERGDPSGAPTPDWHPVFEAGCVRWRRDGSTLEVCRLRRGWFWSFPGEERGPFDLALSAILDANDKHPPTIRDPFGG